MKILVIEPLTKKEPSKAVKIEELLRELSKEGYEIETIAYPEVAISDLEDNYPSYLAQLEDHKLAYGVKGRKTYLSPLRGHLSITDPDCSQNLIRLLRFLQDLLRPLP